MAYTAWSVVYGEQPTAAKWNQLGTNDAGFKDGTNFDAGIITNNHIAAGALYSSKAFIPYKFRAYRAAAWNVGNGIGAVVAFDTEDYDTGGNHSAGVFTAPVAGYYYFNTSLQYGAVGVGTILITSLALNGTGETVRLIETIVGSGGNHTTAGSTIMKLAAGDTVRVLARGAGGSGGVGTSITYFVGALISAT